MERVWRSDVTMWRSDDVTMWSGDDMTMWSWWWDHVELVVGPCGGVMM